MTSRAALLIKKQLKFVKLLLRIASTNIMGCSKNYSAKKIGERDPIVTEYTHVSKKKFKKVVYLR